MLEIRNLHACVDGREILKGIDLTIPAGEVHAVMGPNGSGKSTLSYVLAGRDGYKVTEGSVLYRGQDLLAMKTEERACLGLFLAFQNPVEIPGVTGVNFLKTAVNAVRRSRGQSELDAMQFLKLARRKAKELGVGEEMLRRAVNTGFSGGEKKRYEALQMALLEPKFMILDETDSGLDIDALRVVAEAVDSFRSPERAMLVITHYQRILDYIVPDKVHVLAGGRIVQTGGKELAVELESTGYAQFTEQAA
ncbi:Fe-S cluster assembly ATPase SufC [Telmatospirillum sp.]|uniref:Fe-S cluster assembly ATPase SufC n=1 Tax=Telmatospirillum sp. TaxID=2079197 RepID=UPI00283EB0D3|nr:Fe-S cluster assembly ATPase SufC [Telmatospirillum sp.]MDR3440473.1 Fe-S cluster assembly ATPase SufC [Telmatospirillum sp.]